jgi:hypothetical protein
VSGLLGALVRAAIVAEQRNENEPQARPSEALDSGFVALDWVFGMAILEQLRCGARWLAVVLNRNRRLDSGTSILWMARYGADSDLVPRAADGLPCFWNGRSLGGGRLFKALRFKLGHSHGTLGALTGACAIRAIAVAELVGGKLGL